MLQVTFWSHGANLGFSSTDRRPKVPVLPRSPGPFLPKNLLGALSGILCVIIPSNDGPALS